VKGEEKERGCKRRGAIYVKKKNKLFLKSDLGGTDTTGFPAFFVIPCVRPNLTIYPFSPASRESVCVFIPFCLLGKKGAMMQKANVSHWKGGKIVRRIELPCVRRSWSLFRR
jgi:hypothetical protein